MIAVRSYKKNSKKNKNSACFSVLKKSIKNLESGVLQPTLMIMPIPWQGTLNNDLIMSTYTVKDYYS